MNNLCGYHLEELRIQRQAAEQRERVAAMARSEEAHSKGEVCEERHCQDCCPHDERDHFICLDCGHEQCPGELIDAMEYWIDPER